MADIARMDYRIKLSFIGEKWGLIIEYRLNFKPTFWTGLQKTQGFGKSTWSTCRKHVQKRLALEIKQVRTSHAQYVCKCRFRISHVCLPNCWWLWCFTAILRKWPKWAPTKYSLSWIAVIGGSSSVLRQMSVMVVYQLVCQKLKRYFLPSACNA